jgi:D-amino-acid dehydrogenase
LEGGVSERIEIAVIGGGVVGLACAHNLAGPFGSVTVIDPGREPPPASWGNAGHIAIEEVEPLANPQAVRTAVSRLFAFGGPLDFRLSDIGVWGPWAFAYLRASTAARAAKGQAALTSLLAEGLPAWRRLAAAAGAPDLVIDKGHVVLWEKAESAAAGRRAWGRSGAPVQIAELTPAERDDFARRLKAPVAGGLDFAGTGQVSYPGHVLEVLRTSFQARGGQLLCGRVRGLKPSDQGFSLTLHDGRRLDAERVLVAAGVWSGPLMRSLGFKAPVIAERGYHLEGRNGGWVDRPVVFEDRFLIVTPFGDRLRATSFVEFGRPDSPPDARKWTRLRHHLRSLGIPMQEPISQWMGARPTLPDYLPALGASPRTPGLFYAFGHQHLGLTLAATTGELVHDMMTGQSPTLDLAPFDLARFGRTGLVRKED